MSESYETYSFDEVQVGLSRSREFKKDATNHEIGDNILLVTSDNPTCKPVPTQSEKKNLGKKKRNPVKKVGSMASEVMSKVSVTTDFQNAQGLFIQSALGKLKYNLDSSDEAYSVTIDNSLLLRVNENESGKVYIFNINSVPYNATGTGGTLNELATLLKTAYDTNIINGLIATVTDEYVVFTTTVEIESFDSVTDGISMGYDIYCSDVSATAELLFDIANNDKVSQPILVTPTGANKQVAFIVNKKSFSSGYVYRLADKLFADAIGTDSMLAPLTYIDLDNRPDNALDILFQRSCGIEDNVAFGSKNEKVVNLLGTTAFTTEHGQEIELENTWTGGDISLIKPNNDDGKASAEWRQSLANGTFRDPSINYPVTTKTNPYSYEFVGDADETGFFTIFCSEIDKKTDKKYDYTVLVAVTNADSPTDIASATVIALNAVFKYAVATSTLGVVEVNVPAMVVVGLYVDLGTEGTTVVNYSTTVGASKSVTFSNTGDGSYTLYLNGIAFTATGTLSTLPSLLADLINKDYRFLANAPSASVLNVYLADVNDNLVVDDHTDTLLLDTVIANLTDSESTIAGAIPSFFYLTRLRAGEIGVNMEGFCDTDAVTIDFSRTVQVVKSVCTKQGLRGIFNANYTLYLELNAKDTDADKIYNFYNKYKDNQEFGVVGYNSDLGLSFCFPVCTIEEWSGDENSDEQIATKYKINVNFDPRISPCLLLPQSAE